MVQENKITLQNLVLHLATTTASNTHMCLGGFLCANETFISIYGVIFTIVISLGVYIYSLQDKAETAALTNKTKIEEVIKNSILSFVFSFLAFPSPLYEFINFVFVASLILGLLNAFGEVFKFNKNELSRERVVNAFKEGIIRQKLKQFEDLKIKNDLLNKDLEEKREKKEIERFLLDEDDDSYHFIRAQSDGYITNVDLSVLSTREDVPLTGGINQASLKESHFYVPYTVSNGAPVDFDSIILGIKKGEGEIDEEKLRSFISISNEFENPASYIEAEVHSNYSEMFALIKDKDAKGLEWKLKEFSSFLDHFIDKVESYVSIIQFINDDFIFPLQKYAFKQGDIDCIRKVVSFSLGYIYQSLDKKTIQTFNIFLRNFGNAFYESFCLTTEVRSEFHDAYFRWLKEIARYSIKSKVKKDKDYVEYATKFLSSLNGWLKIAFDNKDLDTFEKTLAFLNDSFSRERYEHDEDLLLDEIILVKKAVIFGFTAWMYKHYSERREEDFYKNALSLLLKAIQKDPVYYHTNVGDDLNYYLSIYLEAIKISEGKTSLGWDSWDMVEERVYTVTIREDIKNLLVDRILKIVVDNPTLNIDIKNGNYNNELSLIKEGNQQFDPLIRKTKDSFVATQTLTDEQFSAAKANFYRVFSKVAEKYETDVRTKLIQQPLDDSKFEEFVKGNFESYREARVLDRIQKFTKETEKKNDGFGYNMLLPKDEFVSETSIHYVHDDQFGENLARSEDNKILESIHDRFSLITSLKKSEIRDSVYSDKDLKAIVLWTNGHIYIEETNPEDFKSYWQITDSRKNNGPYYQGSIGGVPVYIVYKLKEFRDYPDTIFAFRGGAFSVKEFEIAQDEDFDEVNTKRAEDSSSCITLSVTNLSPLEAVRTKIVEKWIEKDPASVQDKTSKIEELKTSVVFKLYKGYSKDGLTLDESKVKIFHIE